MTSNVFEELPQKTLHEMPWFVSPCCSLRIGIELQHWKGHAKSCERSTRGQLWGSHFQAAAPMGQRLLQFKSDKHKAIMSAYKEMLIEMFWPQSWKAVNENMFVSCLNYLFFFLVMFAFEWASHVNIPKVVSRLVFHVVSKRCRYNQVMRFTPHFRKLIPLLAQWRMLEGHEQERRVPWNEQETNRVVDSTLLYPPVAPI